MNCVEEIRALAELAADAGAVAVPIAPGDVVVAEWVRFKCRYGCRGYAKHLSCPPYAPAPAETRAMLEEYTSALLVRFDGVPGHASFGPDEIPDDFHMFYRDLILWVNTTIHRLEKTAFYDGFYKAFAFGGYPCAFCEECVAEEQAGSVDESFRRFCREQDRVRPSMEAAGMDVFATARRVGWELKTIPSRNLEYGKILRPDVVSVGLVLLE